MAVRMQHEAIDYVLHKNTFCRFLVAGLGKAPEVQVLQSLEVMSWYSMPC